MGATYGAEVRTALVKVWDLLDYPCGAKAGRRRCGNKWTGCGEAKNCVVATRWRSCLKRISARTIDRLLAPGKSRFDTWGAIAIPACIRCCIKRFR